MSDSLLTTTAAEARPTADGPAASDPTGDAQSDVADISPELWWDRLQEIGQVSEGAALLAGMPISAQRSFSAWATITELGDRSVVLFCIDAQRTNAFGVTEAETVERAVRLAYEVGLPLVGMVRSAGLTIADGIAGVHSWGRVARAMADVSGSVPFLLGVSGPLVGGLALVGGLVVWLASGRSAHRFTVDPAVRGTRIHPQGGVCRSPIPPPPGRCSAATPTSSGWGRRTGSSAPSSATARCSCSTGRSTATTAA